MGFKTKLDFSNNRQVKQFEGTITELSGGTTFGVPFSALTTGPNPAVSGISQSYFGLTSDFSGTTGTTNYVWADTRMSLGEPSLSAITPSNSGVTSQDTGFIFTANTTTIVDGNTVILDYSGVSFGIYVLTMDDLGSGNYSGTVWTQQLDILSADTIGYTGRTIWVDVSGYTRTDDLIISKNPIPGYVWTCLDLEGKGFWAVNASGGSGTDTYVTGGTYNNNLGTATYTNSTGGTFSVNGFLTGDTYWESGSTGSFSIKTINDSGLDATGNYSVAQGYLTLASGDTSHAEGYQTTAGNYSHAEGFFSQAEGVYAHAEGFITRSLGTASHAEGHSTYSTSFQSHAEGIATSATSDSTHAEGDSTLASGLVSHAEGANTIASGTTSHAQGSQTIAGSTASHAEGGNTSSLNIASHAEGANTIADGAYSHAEGQTTTASGYASHSEGYITVASGQSAHSEGYLTNAFGFHSHAEGQSTTASGYNSHAEGTSTIASGFTSHAEGNFTTAEAESSHAEGNLTIARGITSHAQGYDTLAFGDYSHAGGSGSTASGTTSFIHSSGSIVTGNRSVVLGGQNLTGATNDTVYVPYLNINNVIAGPGIIDLGVDATGDVVDQVSDIKFKENINTITNALDTVLALRGVTYNWKDRSKGGDALKLGFIAQEVDSVIPELAYYNPNGDYMGVHYKDVTALLVEAVKELASTSAVTNNNMVFETQSILAEDNNIELNYNGNATTALGGGITVLHAKGVDNNVEFKTDEAGNWVTNNDLIPKALTIPTYTPTSTNDISGSIGNITRDDDYLYIKGVNGWKRSNLEEF